MELAQVGHLGPAERGRAWAPSSASVPTRWAQRGTLPLKSFNHVSIHCRDVQESLRFYTHLMGFVEVKRPTCLDYFEGAWLFNYGIGLHLLKDDTLAATPRRQSPSINPRDHHVSFQCEDIEAVAALLEERGVKYFRQAVVECGITVDQLFFHDPDEHMIEICNCEALPLHPLHPPPAPAPSLTPALGQGACCRRTPLSVPPPGAAAVGAGGPSLSGQQPLLPGGAPTTALAAAPAAAPVGAADGVSGTYMEVGDHAAASAARGSAPQSASAAESALKDVSQRGCSTEAGSIGLSGRECRAIGPPDPLPFSSQQLERLSLQELQASASAPAGRIPEKQDMMTRAVSLNAAGGHALGEPSLARAATLPAHLC